MFGAKASFTVLWKMFPMRVCSFLWLFSIPFCSINLSINVSMVTGQSLSHQQSLLLQLKEHLIFNPLVSKKLVHWNQTDDCCQWKGVTCSKGLVIALDLSEESISGGLGNQSSLFSLQHLQSLNLAYNDFHSAIPSGLQNLKSLRYLNLSNAGFSGQIPIEISYLTRLAILDMSISFAHSLKLEMPNVTMVLQNLTEITELYLDGVRVSAKGKEWCHAISSLQKLRVLSMSSCNLSGPIDDSSLEKLQSLSIIRLNKNSLSSKVPEFFSRFSNLTTLQLNSCDLNGDFPASIFHIEELQVLDISNNLNLQGRLPNFTKHGSLHTLDLSNTNFAGQLPNSLHNLRQLSTLDLSGCQFNGALPSSMSELTRLVHLDLSFNRFTGTLPSLTNSKNLTYLSLYHNDLRGEILFSYFEGLKNLVSIDLGDNSFNGSVPSSLFTLPSLQELKLPNNQLDGVLDEFPNASSSLLEIVDLSGNKIHGAIPDSIFNHTRLRSIQLALNKFNGKIQLNVIQRLRNLVTLDLSHNNLSVDANFRDDHDQSAFPKMSNIMLASCKLTKVPAFLKNQSKLIVLDLSDNEIQEDIPEWISGLDFLANLNLSSNLLTNSNGKFPNFSSNLVVLDLHSNKFQGPISIFPKYSIFLDYSGNGFSFIPSDIGNHMPFIFYLSLSNNSLDGKVPGSFCNASSLRVLDLSYNDFSGTIPECLATMGKNLRVLKLGQNKINGHIPDTVSTSCALRFLDLNGNLISGIIPRSLANCRKLQVLDLGNNTLVDQFPCVLQNISTLRVLILRSNNLQGPITCPNMIGGWEMLEIVDLSMNNFDGKLPGALLRTWNAMIHDDEADQKFSMYDNSDMYERFDPIKFEDTISVINKDFGMKLTQLFAIEPRSVIEHSFSDVFFEYLHRDQLSITVIHKHQQVRMVELLKSFSSMDLSFNHFEGSIPEELMNFKGLHSLNLSHNAFSGRIPSSIKNLISLESLDMSRNSLTEEIPTELASLSFLEVLDLSFNHLEGKIPTGTQIQSFEASSFIGNRGLCGPPLRQSCSNGVQILLPPTSEASHSDTGGPLDWKFLSAELGFIFGFGILILPLIFMRSWRLSYCKLIDDMLYRIFPQLDFAYECHEGQKYRTLRWIRC